MHLLTLLLLPLLASPAPQDRAEAELFLRVDGDTVRAAIPIDIEPDWHLYHEVLGPADAIGKPTTVTFEGAPVSWSKVRFPEPLRLEQPFGRDDKPTWIWGHEDSIVLYALGRLAPGGDLSGLQVTVDGLTCIDDGSCQPYRQVLTSSGRGSDKLFARFPADLTIDGGPAPAAPATDGEPAADPTAGGAAEPPGNASASAADDAYWDGAVFADYAPRTEGPERSLGLWLVFAFVAGMILNVMPCVLPVVSIKVLSFVQQAGEKRARIFQLGLAFAAGILTVFLVLAALAAFAGKGWGEQFQSATFLIVMIAVVFAFSLSLFDVYEIGVPHQVGSLAGAPREGLPHAFFMGIMSTVLATPCSGPFLGSTLTWALAQPAQTVFLVFATVGLGMAFPYVVLTANPGFLKYVPKPGPWMQTFKHLMGFLLLGTVIFLMVSLRQDLLLYTTAFLIFVAMACWVWGRYATFDQTPGRRLGTAAVAVAVLVVGGRLSFVELHDFFEGAEGEGHLVWEDFDPDKLAEYHAAGRSVFLDFTADWCLTCKTNEKVVYESDRIVDLLDGRNIVAMKADETGESARTRAIKRLRTSLGANSIPFMAVFPGDDWRRPQTAKDLVTVSQVAAMLEACPR